MAIPHLSQVSISTPAGTPPLVVTSSDLVSNLNAQYLNGQLGGYYQNAGNLNAGTLLAARLPAFTGDVSSTVGTVGLTLASVGTAGTYTKVTVNAKGLVTAGAALASADLPTYTGTITSGQVTTGLGFTPYNASNPSNYITASASITGNAATATKSNSIAYPFQNSSLNLNTTGGANEFTTFNSYYPSGGAYNQPLAGVQHFKILQFGRYDSVDANFWRGQMAMSFYEDRMWFRKEYAQTWGSWMELVHSGNYNSYSPTLGGTGATGNWAINITGSATQFGGYTQDLQTVVGTGDYLLIRNQAASKISLASAASVAAIVQGAASGSWGISVTGNAATVGNVSKVQLFNNTGLTHGAYTTFAALPDFGFYFMQGQNVADAPPAQAANQYYVVSMGLGDNYSYSQYAKQIALPRIGIGGGNNYLWIREREQNAWGSWGKVYAGYADSAGTATDATKLPLAGGTMTGNLALNTGVIFNRGSAPSITNIQCSIFNELNGISNAESLNSRAYGGFKWQYWDGSVTWMQLTSAGLTINGNNTLHAGNYNSYALPLTGGTLTGALNGTTAAFSGAITQGGNQVLHAGNVATYAFAKSGAWAADLVSSYGYTRETGMQMSGGSEFVVLSKSGQGYLLVDGSYIAAEAGGFYSTNNSSGATLLGFTADTTTSLNFNTTAVKLNGNQVLHAGNYSAYALPLTGGTLTGTITATNFIGPINGNSYNNLSNNYKDIYVYGDVNTYYVVLILGESLYSFGRYSVTRGYNWTGPDTWHTASHKGGLTLDWEWSGDTAWGGNDKAIRIIEFNESYSSTVAGLGYPVNGGVIIWLRGGGINGALYRIRTPIGSNSTVTIYDNLSIAGHVASTTFTAANSAVFSTRADVSNVSAEILARYPVRDSGGLYVNNNAVLHAGNYTSYPDATKLPLAGGTMTGGLTVTNLFGNANSASLYANNGSGYGSWKVGGTRNGWYGIEFESGSNLMMNSNQVGFHRNGYGWQLWWSAGTAYCHKGDPGAGTQATILDSSNVATYALPIGGGALTGTLSIDTSGTAGASTVAIKRSGQGVVGFGSYAGSWRSALQIQSNANDRMLFFVPPEADYQYGVIRSVNGGLKIDVGGTTGNGGGNAISIETSGAVSMPGTLNVVGAVTQNGNQVLHAGNFSSYALPVGGTAANATNSAQLGGNASANFVQGEGSRGRSTGRTSGTANSLTDPSGFYFGSGVTGMPSGDWFNWINCIGNGWGAPDGYGYQLAYSFWSDDIRMRRLESGTWRSWVSLIHSGNIGSQTVATASNATQFGGEGNTNFMRGLPSGTEANLNTYTDNGFRSITYTGYSRNLLTFNPGGSTGTVQHEYFYNIPSSGWRVRNKTDNTTWSAWGNVVMTDTNQGALTGTVITTNSNTTVSGLNIGGNAASASSLAANTNTIFKVIRFTGEGYDSGNGAYPTNYGIYQEGGSWTYPYPDLCIGFHTGIKIGAQTGYGGIRFYNTETWGTEIFSVGNGDNNVRVVNTLYVGGNVALHAGNVATYALPIGGGTITGNRPLTIDSGGGGIYIKGDTGGWATGYYFNGSSGTYKGGFGALGGGDALTNFWVGPAYNNTLMTFSSSANNSQVALQQGGNQVLHAGNFSAYALPYTGGTLTGALNGTTASFSTKVLSSRFHDSGDAFLFRSGSGAGTTRHINLADSGGDPSQVGSATGITCGERSDNAAYYMIYVKAPYNNGSSTHSRLVLGWHTGVEIGANASYGGVRFMNDSPGVSTSEIFSVGKGDSNVRVTNTIFAGAFSGPLTGNVTGSSGSCTGNAASASSVAWTNVSGRPTAVSSFSNDSGYITSGSSISGSSGSCTGNAASVTDGVYLSTNQSIGGVKTFSSAPIATNIAKAWVHYNKSTTTITASYNVSSVTSNGTGVFTVNFTNAMVDTNYVVAGTATYGYDDQDIYGMALVVPRRSTAQQAGSCRLATEFLHAAQIYDCVAVRAVFYR